MFEHKKKSINFIVRYFNKDFYRNFSKETLTEIQNGKPNKLFSMIFLHMITIFKCVAIGYREKMRE